MSNFLDRIKKGVAGNPGSKFAPSDEPASKAESEEIKDAVPHLPPPIPSNFANPSSMAPPPQGLSTKPSLFGSVPKTGPSPFAPMEWNEFFDSREFISDACTKGPIFFCLHGAGHSALSFAVLARELKNDFRVISFDFRGHGSSKVSEEHDFSADTLVSDTIEVLGHVANKFPNTSIVVVGHSMGGSIATKAVQKIFDQKSAFAWYSYIKALFVIDVVEGLALEALPFMDNIVHSRPKSFRTLEAAVKWNVSSGNVRNATSARVSTPATLKEKPDGKGGKVYVWRTDLLKSKEHWEGWFKGLSKAFLSVPLPKQLVLAGSDRMDKELTIAQMQGKFKVEVVPEVGHVVQEDNPKRLALSFRNFVTTFHIHEQADHQDVVTSVSGKTVVIGPPKIIID